MKAHCIGSEPGLDLRLCPPSPHYVVYQGPYALREWVPMVKGQGHTNCLLLIPPYSLEALTLAGRDSVIVAAEVCIF